MNKKQLIWDLPLRLFHWLFVLSIGLLWLTSELGLDFRQYHFYLGYFVLFLLTFRLSWGVLGTRYSKFSQFFPTPQRILSYVNTHSNNQNVGHNPLGALMVFLMFFLVLLQAISGLFLSDDIIFDAPYYGVLSSSMQSIMNGIHYYVFDFILASIALHISAIIYHERIKKNDLVLPMITGKKFLPNKSDSIEHSAILRAIIIALFCAGWVYWLVVLNAPVIDDYSY